MEDRAVPRAEFRKLPGRQGRAGPHPPEAGLSLHPPGLSENLNGPLEGLLCARPWQRLAERVNVKEPEREACGGRAVPLQWTRFSQTQERASQLCDLGKVTKPL